jgi:beta-lactamase regulating signal transducer with metallopeptidase domain
VLKSEVRGGVRGPAGLVAQTAIPTGGVVGGVPAPAQRVSLASLMFFGWMAGAGLVLLPVAGGLWEARRLRRSAGAWVAAQALTGDLAREAGIRRRVEALTHESLSGPITCGVLRPSIILPRDAEQWSGRDLRRALVHELEHVWRCDWLTQCAARAVCGGIGFIPWRGWRGGG